MPCLLCEQREMKDTEENISLQEAKDLRIETDLETTLEIVLRDSPDRDRRNAKRVNRSRNKSRNNSRDRSNDRAARNGKNDFRQKSSRHCEYCDQDGHTWKYCWEMQANAKKARRLKEMDDRDDDPSDTFNSMVSEDIISDDDLDDFIRNFSDMTELN